MVCRFIGKRTFIESSSFMLGQIRGMGQTATEVSSALLVPSAIRIHVGATATNIRRPVFPTIETNRPQRFGRAGINVRSPDESAARAVRWDRGFPGFPRARSCFALPVDSAAIANGASYRAPSLLSSSVQLVSQRPLSGESGPMNRRSQPVQSRAVQAVEMRSISGWRLLLVPADAVQCGRRDVDRRRP